VPEALPAPAPAPLPDGGAIVGSGRDVGAGAWGARGACCTWEAAWVETITAVGWEAPAEGVARGAVGCGAVVAAGTRVGGGASVGRGGSVGAPSACLAGAGACVERAGASACAGRLVGASGGGGGAVGGRPLRPRLLRRGRRGPAGAPGARRRPGGARRPGGRRARPAAPPTGGPRGRTGPGVDVDVDARDDGTQHRHQQQHEHQQQPGPGKDDGTPGGAGRGRGGRRAGRRRRLIFRHQQSPRFGHRDRASDVPASGCPVLTPLPALPLSSISGEAPAGA
jgi:hypothetical protein